MKLKTRLNLLAAVPVLVLAILLGFISANVLSSAVFDTNYAGMQATATTLRDLFQSINTSDSENNNDDILASLDYIKDQTGFDVTYFHGDTRFLTTITDARGNRQIGTKAGSDVIAAVLQNGRDYKDDKLDILGTRYIGYYVPVYQSGSATPTGMTFLGVPYKSVRARIMSGVWSIVIPAVILIALSLLFAVFQGNRISKDIQTGIDHMQKLEQGELGVTMDEKMLKRPDVIGDLCRSIKSLSDRLSMIVTEIKEQCFSLNENAETANRTAADLSDAMAQISAAMEEVAATTASQAEDAENVNENIHSMGELIEHISTESGTAMTAMEELLTGMQQVEESVTDISNQTGETNTSVDKIDSAADLISTISFQTRILALNATIEAARAGDYGRGFAVVANEIQHLSENSEESTKNIQDVLEELKRNSGLSLDGTKSVMNTVASLRDKLHITEDVFTTLMSEIGLKSEKTSSVAAIMNTSLNEERLKAINSVNGLAAASEEIAASMEETSASVQTVANLAETMQNQAESLSEISDILREHLRFFKG